MCSLLLLSLCFINLDFNILLFTYLATLLAQGGYFFCKITLAPLMFCQFRVTGVYFE